jgi:hypothetical protein
MLDAKAYAAEQVEVPTVQRSAWERRVAVGLALYALAILVAGIAAGLRVGAIIGTMVCVFIGGGTVLAGLGLTAEDTAYRPRTGESDFIWRWTVYLLPLWLARALTVLLGCVFLAAASYAWSVNRPLSTGASGRYVASFSPREPGDSFSFVVAGGNVRNAVLAWQASCASGAVVAGSVEPGDTPASGWASATDYVLGARGGAIAHVHTITDTGSFRDSQTAVGALSLSVIVAQNGRTIDHCRTGVLHWIAHRQNIARHAA